MRFFCLVFSSLIFFLWSCASKKPFIAKPPEVAFQQSVEKVKEVSTINLPIEIPLSEVERQINEQLGNLLFEDNSMDNNGGDNLMLRVTKRLPMIIDPKGGNQFNIKVPVNIWAKAGWKLEKFGMAVSKYEETQFDIDINFLTKINLNENWKISTQTNPNGYKWVSEPKLKIGFFEVPITSIIQKIIDRELPNVTQIIDNEVAKINIKPMVEKAWHEIQAPFLVNETYQAWLKITPLEIMMTPLANKGRNVRVGLGIKANTETILGTKPGQSVMANLPPLKLVEKLDEKFEVGMITQIPYSQAKKIALEQTGGKTYSFQEGKYNITVQDLDIYGQKDFMIVAATLTGSLNGKVYLKGKPVFDPATMMIRLAELDYDLETKNKLIKAADWLAHGKFIRMMEPHFSFPVSGQLNEARKLIQQNLAGNQLNKNIALHGSLDKLQPESIQLIAEGIQSIIVATGKIELKVAGW